VSFASFSALTVALPRASNSARNPILFQSILGAEIPTDSSPYNVIAPTQDIGAINPEHAAMARLSAKLPWNRLDAVPQEISDEILWADVHGASVPSPARGPDASLVEHERAVVTWALLRAHKNLKALLSHSAER
jgi:hypothetical protein